MFTCAHGSATNCIVKKQELIVSLPDPIVTTVATNTLPLISSTTAFNQNNRIEGHFRSSQAYKKIVCLMAPFLKWLLHVRLCCRIMCTQGTEFIFFLALSMMHS